MERLLINQERLLGDLRHLAALTDTPGEGVTRFSYGATDRQARDYLRRAAAQYRLTWTEDPVGNVRIGLPENRPWRPTLLAGSHIDTVRRGGWLDGAYGSVSALEVLRVLAEAGPVLDRNVEAVFFAEEEGSNFNATLTGSKFATGYFGPPELETLRDAQGVTLGEMLRKNGYAGASGGPMAWDFKHIEAMVELHIEQGPVLERERVSTGIVEGIFGLRLAEFIREGQGNHAGATPMSGRKDPLAAAARAILLIEEIARSDPEKLAVATVGQIEAFPGCTNVIPEKVRFTAEVRHAGRKQMDRIFEKILQGVALEAECRNVTLTSRELASNPPIRLDPELADRICVLAGGCGMGSRRIYSGAVHDASMLAAKTRVGMIFVPSIGGRSHVKEEDTPASDLMAGSQLLLDTIRSLLERPLETPSEGRKE